MRTYYFSNHYCIHAIHPCLSGTATDFDTQSRRLGKHVIAPKILKIKSTNFLRPIEGEGFVINNNNGKCCMYCRGLIIAGIPVVIDCLESFQL